MKSEAQKIEILQENQKRIVDLIEILVDNWVLEDD